MVTYNFIIKIILIITARLGVLNDNEKTVTLLCMILISSLFISCVSTGITYVKNTDSMLSGMIEHDNNTKIVNLTNKEVINNIITDVKWTGKIIDNGSKYIYATGKYIDIEKAKKNAYLTQLFFMVISSMGRIDWDQADPIMYTKYMIGFKKSTDDIFLLSDTSKGTFMFDESGEIQEPKDRSLLFNYLTFIGYDISLNGIDKVLDLPIIDNF